MDLQLIRKQFTEHSTIGELSVDGAFECFTLEDVVRPVKIKGMTAIPAGSYEIVVTQCADNPSAAAPPQIGTTVHEVGSQCTTGMPCSRAYATTSAVPPWPLAARPSQIAINVATHETTRRLAAI